MLFLPTCGAVAVPVFDHAAPSEMRLVPCSPPSEPLDAAPRTALLGDIEPAADWEGFWSRATDSYYTRCTTHEGATHWYRITDESMEVASLGAVTTASRVLPFRGAGMRRVSLILAASPNGRPMLVGSSARRAAK